MKFELCQNKYFHISEGNMNIEVSVSGNHLVYGLKIKTFENKKAAKNKLHELYNIFEQFKDSKFFTKKNIEMLGKYFA